MKDVISQFKLPKITSHQLEQHIIKRKSLYNKTNQFRHNSPTLQSINIYRQNRLTEAKSNITINQFTNTFEIKSPFYERLHLMNPSKCPCEYHKMKRNLQIPLKKQDDHIFEMLKAKRAEDLLRYKMLLNQNVRKEHKQIDQIKKQIQQNYIANSLNKANTIKHQKKLNQQINKQKNQIRIQKVIELKKINKQYKNIILKKKLQDVYNLDDKNDNYQQVLNQRQKWEEEKKILGKKILKFIQRKTKKNKYNSMKHYHNNVKINSYEFPIKQNELVFIEHHLAIILNNISSVQDILLGLDDNNQINQLSMKRKQIEKRLAKVLKLKNNQQAHRILKHVKTLLQTIDKQEEIKKYQQKLQLQSYQNHQFSKNRGLNSVQDSIIGSKSSLINFKDKGRSSKFISSKSSKKLINFKQNNINESNISEENKISKQYKYMNESFDCSTNYGYSNDVSNKISLYDNNNNSNNNNNVLQMKNSSIYDDIDKKSIKSRKSTKRDQKINKKSNKIIDNQKKTNEEKKKQSNEIQQQNNQQNGQLVQKKKLNKRNRKNSKKKIKISHRNSRDSDCSSQYNREQQQNQFQQQYNDAIKSKFYKQNHRNQSEIKSNKQTGEVQVNKQDTNENNQQLKTKQESKQTKIQIPSKYLQIRHQKFCTRNIFQNVATEIDNLKTEDKFKLVYVELGLNKKILQDQHIEQMIKEFSPMFEETQLEQFKNYLFNNRNKVMLQKLMRMIDMGISEIQKNKVDMQIDIIKQKNHNHNKQQQNDMFRNSESSKSDQQRYSQTSSQITKQKQKAVTNHNIDLIIGHNINDQDKGKKNSDQILTQKTINLELQTMTNEQMLYQVIEHKKDKYSIFDQKGKQNLKFSTDKFNANLQNHRKVLKYMIEKKPIHFQMLNKDVSKLSQYVHYCREGYT